MSEILDKMTIREDKGDSVKQEVELTLSKDNKHYVYITTHYSDYPFLNLQLSMEEARNLQKALNIWLNDNE